MPIGGNFNQALLSGDLLYYEDPIRIKEKLIACNVNWDSLKDWFDY